MRKGIFFLIIYVISQQTSCSYNTKRTFDIADNTDVPRTLYMLSIHIFLSYTSRCFFYSACDIKTSCRFHLEHTSSRFTFYLKQFREQLREQAEASGRGFSQSATLRLMNRRAFIKDRVMVMMAHSVECVPSSRTGGLTNQMMMKKERNEIWRSFNKNKIK